MEIWCILRGMSGKSVFERLAATLTTEERERLLGSIRSNMERDLAPVGVTPEGKPPTIVEKVHALGIWGRIRLFLTQILTGATREDVITRWTLSQLRQQISKSDAPGVDAQRRVFTEDFAQSLEQLREAIVRLAPVLEPLEVNRPEIIFRLAAAEIPEINRDLFHRTSREYLEQQDESNERILRRQLTMHLDDRLGEIPSRNAARIRRALTQSDQLLRLGQFSFVSMIGAFSGTAEAGDRRCAFDYISNAIDRLTTELSYLSEPLEQTALETIVLVACAQDDTAEEEHQEKIRAVFGLLTDALAAFRAYSEKFPLVAINRLIREDPWWEPAPQERAGHDWLSVYREKLEERIAREVLRVSLHRQVREQIKLLEEIIEDQVVPFPDLPDGRGDVHVAHYHIASVVWTFSTTYRRVTLTPLRLILNSAEFYKSSNRAQYNDAFNDYDQLPVEIQKLRKLIEPNGDWGTILHGDESIERRQTMARRVDEEVQRLVARTQTNLEMLANLLGGILYARPGSPYDTIANYGQIGGRRNAELIEEIKQVQSGLQRIVGVIGEVGALEKRALDNEMYLKPT